MKSYQIHLIRHGLTAANLAGQYIGRTDAPLTAQGIRELQALQNTGGYPAGDVYYTSPRLRCIQTMNILYPGQDCYEVPGLDEIDFGAWEGKTAAELDGDALFARWLEHSAEVSPPDGENAMQFYSRVCATFEQLVEGIVRTGVRSAVIVTHGGVIMNLLAAYGLPQAGFYDWLTAPGHGYSLRIMPSLWMNGKKVEVYDTIPSCEEEPDEEAKRAVDLGREAAQRSFGQTMPQEPGEPDREGWEPYE